MKNVKYTYKWTEREDCTLPNNNYSDQTEYVIVEPPYDFADWLNDNLDRNGSDGRAAQDGDTYYIIDSDGNRTGEAFLVISETETDEPIS